MYCTKCGKQIPENSSFCTSCGNSVMNSDSSSIQTQNPANQIGMKWHAALQFFILLGSISNLISGILMVTGLEYYLVDSSPELVYSFFGIGLQIVDVLFGLCMILFSVYGFFVFVCLHNKKSIGPKLLILMYIINIVLSFLYALSASLVTEMNMFDASTISGFISPIVMIIVNKIYYDNRAHLFVN